MGETAVMSVLKMWLHSVHKGKKRVQNLDINILSQIDGRSIIYIGHSTQIIEHHGKTLCAIRC